MWPRAIRRLSNEQVAARAVELAAVSREIDLQNSISRARKEAEFLVAALRASKGPRWRPLKRHAMQELYQLRIQCQIAVRALNLKKQRPAA